jgi:hypothetical protein
MKTTAHFLIAAALFLIALAITNAGVNIANAIAQTNAIHPGFDALLEAIVEGAKQ